MSKERNLYRLLLKEEGLLLKQKNPKKIVKKCETHDCNKVATKQRLGCPTLVVFNVCDEHFKKGYDSNLEKACLGTYKRFGPWGVKEVDSYFKKKLAS